MLKALNVVIMLAALMACSSSYKPTDTCMQAVQKADELLQLAEQSLQVSARQITAVAARNTDEMIQLNQQLHQISQQTDVVGPEYQALRSQCLGVNT